MGTYFIGAIFALRHEFYESSDRRREAPYSRYKQWTGGHKMKIIKLGFALALGAILIMFGIMKFTGSAHIFAYIEYKAGTVGIPMASLFFPAINYVTGILEIVAGITVIIPATRQLGSFLAVTPLMGAVVFHLSPLLGTVTPDGYADPIPASVLAAGGPFLDEHFSSKSSATLFTIAVVMLSIALINLFLQRRPDTKI